MPVQPVIAPHWVGVTKHGRNFKQRSGSQGWKTPPCQTSGTNSSHFCASCGGNHLPSTFRNVKYHICGKLGHMHKVCCATSGVIQCNTQSPILAGGSHSWSSNISDFATSWFWKAVIGDLASPLTFVNSKTWHDLDKPRLQSIRCIWGPANQSLKLFWSQNSKTRWLH